MYGKKQIRRPRGWLGGFSFPTSYTAAACADHLNGINFAVGQNYSFSDDWRSYTASMQVEEVKHNIYTFHAQHPRSGTVGSFHVVVAAQGKIVENMGTGETTLYGTIRVDTSSLIAAVIGTLIASAALLIGRTEALLILVPVVMWLWGRMVYQRVLVLRLLRNAVALN